LRDKTERGADRFAFDQGTFMKPPSPSRLNAILVLEHASIAGVWVGGHARSRDTRLIEA
jgi:hypothetical protein